MGFRINTNVAAMNAHTNSTMNNRNLDDSLAKLSSGLRINKAADDASGLAIANSLRNQANSLGQAISNGNDAIGLIQTADGALNEYSKILDSIKTKSVQAASDGQNTQSRLAIQKDITRLMEGLNAIAKTTTFNGQKLLSGTFVNKEFQMGANANETIKTSIASTETSQIGQTTRATLKIEQEGINQLTLKSAITGKVITLDSVNILSNNNPANGMGVVADQLNRNSGETGITAKAIIEATTSLAIAAGITGTDFSINGVNIGSINVTANDADSTLVSAINNKTTETGVIATKTVDGKITLSSTDGRSIKVEGDMSAVMGTSAESMSTIGYLEIVQSGSSTFQITGAKAGVAVAGSITVTGSMVTVQDSVLSVGSTIVSDAVLAAGTKLGHTLTGTAALDLFSSTKDGTLAVGSVIGSGSKIEKGTQLGGNIRLASSVVLSGDMLIKAGSTLGSGTVFDAGTVLKQDFTIAGIAYKAGTTLVTDLTLTADVTLSKDMTMFVDVQTPNALIALSSTLLAGTVVGADVTTTGSSTLSFAMVAKAGTSLVSSTLAVGSAMGDAIVTSGNRITTDITDLKVGSTLGSGSILLENSTIGGSVEIRVSMSLNQNMIIKAGSTLTSGTTLKAGTVINQDLSDAQVGGGVGSGLKAGTTLGTNITLTDPVNIIKDFTMLRGTGVAPIIFAGSVLSTNGGDQNSIIISDALFTNLSDVDVTTLDGAMRAIDTLNAAITNLDTIRSDLGSVQNQVVSTINNISATQVNVKAAESSIRDVDFASESANFSKYNILAQSGTYAMAQANAVQQNVMRLLQ